MIHRFFVLSTKKY